jgi:hypothetical protein
VNAEARAVARLIARALQPSSAHAREREAIVRELRDALRDRARTLREEAALLELAHRALTNLPDRDHWHLARGGRCDVCGEPVSEKAYAVSCPQGHRLHVPRCLSFETHRSDRTKTIAVCRACEASGRP